MYKMPYLKNIEHSFVSHLLSYGNKSIIFYTCFPPHTTPVFIFLSIKVKSDLPFSVLLWDDTAKNERKIIFIFNSIFSGWWGRRVTMIRLFSYYLLGFSFFFLLA